MTETTSSRIDQDANRIRIAFHEAGHAVATWVHGLTLLRVEVGSDDGTSKCAEGSSQLRARLGEAHFLAVLGTIHLAGECAQRKWRQEFVSFGCDVDVRNARYCADRLAQLTADDPQECFLDLALEAKNIVDENWPAISALAAALVREGAISGEEVARIIQRS